MSELRFRAKVVRPEPREPHVACPIVKGGETADSAQHDVLILTPYDGRYENVEVRYFDERGIRHDFRVAADTLREALGFVEAIR